MIGWLIVFLLSFGIPSNAPAQGSSSPSVSLSTFEVENEYHGAIKVHYREEFSRVINIKVKHEFFEEMGYSTRLIETKLAESDSVSYTVDYNPGASNDPTFIIYKTTEGELVKLRSIGGTKIAFPGDGAFYVSGHTNTMFKKRRKFRMDNSGVVEITQPFYYVGLESSTTRDITIYADTLGVRVVSHLPAGSDVTVLINSHDYYLIKTPFGLTGWIKITRPYEGPLKGLFFAGD